MNIDNHAAYVMQIDQFVRNLNTSRCNVSLEHVYNHICQLSPNLELTLRQDIAYSESIKIYGEALGGMCQSVRQGQYLYPPETVNDFIQYIINQSYRIKLQDDNFRQQESRNRSSLENYLRQLLSHYARLLFIRIDFAIKSEYRHEVEIEQFQALIRIMNNRYSNGDRCFAGMQGYAWAIEQGLDKGFHCHTLLIYDGNKHQNDFGIGLAVANSWHILTNGKGCCFISNDPSYKQQFENQNCLGIGMIHRSNTAQVENAIRTALYLVNPEKNQQYLRLRIPRMRTFGYGQFDRKFRRGIVAGCETI